MTTPFPPLYLVGQTGSGKSAVAHELARLLSPVEIVNADAFQVYQGFEIISAAPSMASQSLFPHHLFGISEPSSDCDAATFARLAKTVIAEIGMRALPLVVGGSGLYLKAITHGLAPTPKGDPQLRGELDALSLETLVNRYEALDPAGAARTNLKNRRYVTRNIEICLLTGRPASLLKNEWKNNQPEIRAIYLQRERADLYDRINRRTLVMFAAGVIEEIGRLGSLSATAEKAIGLREIQAHLRGELDRKSCIEMIQQNTRRYAKRQESWFKRESSLHRILVNADEEPFITASRIEEWLRSQEAPRLPR